MPSIQNARAAPHVGQPSRFFMFKKLLKTFTPQSAIACSNNAALVKVDKRTAPHQFACFWCSKLH